MQFQKFFHIQVELITEISLILHLLKSDKKWQNGKRKALKNTKIENRLPPPLILFFSKKKKQNLSSNEYRTSPFFKIVTSNLILKLLFIFKNFCRLRIFIFLPIFEKKKRKNFIFFSKMGMKIKILNRQKVF